MYPVALSDERGVNRHVDETHSHSGHPCALLREALKLLHGASCDREWDNIKEERNNAAGVQAKRPWELFTDRTIRWQLLTIFLLNAAQQLNGINAVCTQTRGPPPDSSLPPSVSVARETYTKAAQGLFLFFQNVFLQIYFYTNYLFQQAGIPSDKIPYVTIGTGACECITALTCVSICGFFFCLFVSVCIMAQVMHQIMMRCPAFKKKTALGKEMNECEKLEEQVVWPSEKSNEWLISLRDQLALRKVCFPWHGFVVL